MDMDYQQALTILSGIRFSVTYSFFGTEHEAYMNAQSTCTEQTIEFPAKYLPDNPFWNDIQGKIEKFEKINDEQYLAKISYAIETVSDDIIQILNVIYGNIAQIRNIRVEDVEFPTEIINWFQGPRFGIEGIRALCNVPSRALICATLKPMGLTMESYAQMAYEFALGGSDLIKDDHGITNQPFARFEDRISHCVEAIAKANAQTGGNSLYAANVSGPIDQIEKRALYAKQAGAGALLILPGLVGWDAVRYLRENDEIGLPILVHGAFGGIYYASRQAGFSGKVAFSIIPRLVGADIYIMPNYIGRLYSTKQECSNAQQASGRPMGHLRPIFHGTGGGTTLETIPELMEFYGDDIVYIMGGGLHSGSSIVESCKAFRKMLAHE
jgi:ribulose-bisphosphate carboxylase large chain